MLNTVPVTSVAGRGRTLRLAFVSAVVSLVAAFAAVGSTIPLFNIYRAEDGFTNAGISMTVVAYSAATLTTLLVLGRLSNHVGRRPTSIASLGLLLLGCLVLLNVHDIGILIAGRLLMGLGAGLASSSLTCLHRRRRARQADLAGLRRLQPDSHARPRRRRHRLRRPGPVRPLATRPHLSGCHRPPPPVNCAHRCQPGNRHADAGCLAITATPSPRTSPGQASAPRRGGGVPGHLGDREPSTKPSCPRWSKINSTPAARSSSDWCSPPTWVPAFSALPSAADSHRQQPNASA